MKAKRSKASSRRRLVIASVVFGLFIVFDIVLFGWLILNSLSQREIEEVLLETREQAEPIAEGLKSHAETLGGDDLFVVVSVAEETKTYIESVLTSRELVRSIEIRDPEGTVVYQQSNRDELPVDGDMPLEPFDPDAPEVQLIEEVEVPIGDLGTLVIGLSEEEIAKRVGVLREDLVRQTSIVGGLTLVLLVVGFVGFLRLFARARSLEAQAEEAERMAYVGTLASGLAHEIRSPLNSLSLNMQMLEEDVRDGGNSSSQIRLLSITRSEIGRLERLATDFLTYAKPRPDEQRDVPMVELLERASDVLGAEARARRVTIEVDDWTQGAEVRVDPGQIGQLLLNLAQNGIAATEGQGRPALIRLISRHEGGSPILEVIDNGRGMTEEESEKMFDLFYSNRKGGTGLGLAIVQRIATVHGAEVEVDTEIGEGTTVRVRFPRRRR
ncbi:MAG: ATP-binding protein [Acidobacteriota bacterium]